MHFARECKPVIVLLLLSPPQYVLIILSIFSQVLLHYLPKILADIGMDPRIAAAGPAFDASFATHAVLAFSVLGFPGGLSFAADKLSVPLESSIKVLRRQLTRNPAENSAIKTLYESMLKQNIDISAAIKEWDQDGDGTGELFCLMPCPFHVALS